MPERNEDARYDLQTLRQVHQEVTESAEAMSMIRDLSWEIRLQLERLHPLYPHRDNFADVRTAAYALLKALANHRDLHEDAHNFTFLGNLAVYREPAQLDSDQFESGE